MPYDDYDGFGESYFHGDDVDEPHPAGYSDYTPLRYNFKESAETLRTILEDSGVDPETSSVTVVGCAHGYIVKELVDLGVDTYGIDVSEYAVSQAPEEIEDRVSLGDATVSGSLPVTDVYYIENVFSVLTDDEAKDCMSNILSMDPDRVIVRLWATNDIDVFEEYHNAKSKDGWIKHLGDHKCVDYFTQKEYDRYRR